MGIFILIVTILAYIDIIYLFYIKSDRSENKTLACIIATVGLGVLSGILWIEYKQKLQLERDLKNYKSGCPEYQQIQKPIYKLKQDESNNFNQRRDY